MAALTSILAATDLSAPARRAAERAARLAHETGAALTLLHVLPSNSLRELMQWLGAEHTMEQQLVAEATADLNKLATDLHSSQPAQLRTQAVCGSVLDEIGRAADEHDASLLVLGARGAGFLRRLVLGTTAERVLHRATRPLLVVRHTPHEPYRKVLIALDFSPWSARAVALAHQVAPHARLVLMTAFQVPFEEKLRFAGVDATTIELYRQQARAQATQRLHDVAHAAGLKPGYWEPRVVEGDASQRIVEQEQELGCDLVLLGKHGHSAAEDLLLGSVTRHVLSEGTTDVLVSTGHDT